MGFRPTVHRLATGLGLGGWVCNSPDGVVIEIEGAAEAVRQFAERLPLSLPPLARLADLETVAVPLLGERSFAVRESVAGQRERALVPPDTALCAACRGDMEDAENRRFHYPFTTCTDCGPRFSLVASLPYDRERTSMACFPLCPECGREYGDPADRRFHAEPVCCPACGPRLWLEKPGTGDRGPGTGHKEQGTGDRAPGTDPETGSGLWLVDRDSTASRPGESTEALQVAREALAQGAIVAVKALGGFQLACRADDPAAVARLRERKRRPTKPFAIMVRDLPSARQLARLAAAEERVLLSPQSPVVLAKRQSDAPVAEGIAPGLDDIGVMLPTTPLHVELFRDASFAALVMTSGNASDEPICRTNREALACLAGIADLFLLHDRDVVRRADDSVVRTTRDGVVLIRRARGFVPDALPLPVASPSPVLALGPFLQTTACLAAGEHAFLSQHVGDLDSEPARAFLAEVVDGLEDFLQVRPRLIIVDAHPDYPSTWLGERLAGERGGELVRVQHHLAHAAATLAEHGRFPAAEKSAAAVVLDGTGWGLDGTAWGGEWLLLRGDLAVRRVAHLEPLPLVGGEAAVREPWRVLAAALAKANAAELLESSPVAGLVAPERLLLVARLASESAWPLATGAGRLFEAAGALLGLVAANGYEGEAAARLEALSASATGTAAPWPELSVDDGTASVRVLPSAKLLAAAARRLASGEAPAQVAAGFHATFCRLVVELTRQVVPPEVEVVALGGGCLVNRLLRSGLADGLRAAGLEPLLPVQLPPGDGGLAYGQAVIGVLAEARGRTPVWQGGE